MGCSADVVLQSELPLPLVNRGKVRDVYDLTGVGRPEELLFVATDRISAFDCVLASGIPCKGHVLNQMSLFWFDYLSAAVRSHFVTADLNAYPRELQAHGSLLAGRSMIVRRAQMIGVECVARGYLAGSGWKEYQSGGTICGIALPSGLRDGDRLPEPIFTPAMKAHEGHDQNVSFEYVAGELGVDLASQLRHLTLELYRQGASHAGEHGILLADTKFEFGFIDGRLCLADEVLTPDSSRWWPATTYRPGGAQPSFDKQFVRDYLESIHWDKRPPAPALPAEVTRQTSEKYREAYQRLTSKPLFAEDNAAV